MKSYPSRLVHDFDLEPGRYPEYEDATPEVGDVALFKHSNDTQQAVIHCACGKRTIIPISDQNQNSTTWQLTSRDPVSLSPSIRTTHNFNPDTECHFYVQGGELQMLDDTTTPLP